MESQSKAWQQRDLAKLFLEDVRAGIPLAAEQLDILLRCIRHGVSRVERIVDLGCGDGILGRTVMAAYPRAKCVFLDFSEHMIEAAKQKADAKRADFVVEDLAAKRWAESLGPRTSFDLVVSGLAVHHLTDERKNELYAEIFEILKPGGMFFNLERVALRSEWSETAYHELFQDSVWSNYQQRGGEKTREQFAEEWKQRLSGANDLPAAVEDQCRWLRDIGYAEVDCFFKVFALTLFGGKKPGP